MIATKNLRRFVERAATPVRVDSNAGIIYGVKLLGRSSRNGRTYTEEAMRNAVSLYNGKKVYLNHPTPDRLNEDRAFESWVGVLENARYMPGGIFADVHLRTKGAHYDELIEAAEKFHGCFGMSHVADGESHLSNGEEIIESISDVFSVDIVTDPATTAGFFESVASVGKLSELVDQFEAAGGPTEIADAFRTIADFAEMQVKASEIENTTASDFSMAGESWRRTAGPREFSAPFMNGPSRESLRRFSARYR